MPDGLHDMPFSLSSRLSSKLDDAGVILFDDGVTIN